MSSNLDGPLLLAAEDERSKGDSESKQWIAVVVFFSVLLGFILVIIYVGPTWLLREALLLLPRNPDWGWYCIWGLATMVSIVGLLPIWPPMCMASGLIFGFYHGVAVNFCSIMGAAAMSMVLGRYVFQEPVRRYLDNGDFPAVRRMVLVLEDSDESLKFQVLFRFLFIPMFIRNYGPATLDIPLWKLLLGSIPHSFWISIIFSSLGCTFKDAAELIREEKEVSFSDMKWQQASILVVSALVAVALSFYATHKYNERVEREISDASLSTQLHRRI